MTPARKQVPPQDSARSFGGNFPEWFNTNWPIITKIVLFLLGTSIVIGEVFISPPPDPYSLAASGALLGLPFTFARNGNGNGK